MAEKSPPLEIRVFDSALSDDDLKRLRASSEDHFVERKSFGDWHKDALKTMVAFANSMPIGQPAFLFIGVKDDGQVEDTPHKLDSIQKKLAELMKHVYPPIYYTPKGMQDGGREYLAVIVFGSEKRPHFAGRSYIREGSQTKEASEQQFARLIAERQSKVYEIRNWIGKAVSIIIASSGTQLAAIVIDCNQHFVAWRSSEDTSTRATSLEVIRISYDYAQDRLKLYVLDPL
jgi:Putative DNA-binding domain